MQDFSCTLIALCNLLHRPLKMQCYKHFHCIEELRYFIVSKFNMIWIVIDQSCCLYCVFINAINTVPSRRGEWKSQIIYFYDIFASCSIRFKILYINYDVYLHILSRRRVKRILGFAFLYFIIAAIPTRLKGFWKIDINMFLNNFVRYKT